MITFEISKWVLVAAICGIMLLGAWIEALVACIYSNRDNAKKARTDKITIEVSPGEWVQLHEGTKDLEQQCEGDYGLFINGLQEKYNSLAKKYEDVLKNQIVTEQRINQLTSAFHRFETDVSNDFHDLEEHVHEWLNGSDANKPRTYDDQYYYNECSVETCLEAMHIRNVLLDINKTYGTVSIRDYCSEFERAPFNLTEDKFGWKYLDEGDMLVRQEKDGWHLKMPEPTFIGG